MFCVLVEPYIVSVLIAHKDNEYHQTRRATRTM